MHICAQGLACPDSSLSIPSSQVRVGPEETQDGSVDYMKSTLGVGLMNLQRLGARTKGQRKWTQLSLPACWSRDMLCSSHWNKAHSIGSPRSRVSSLNSTVLQTPLEAREDPETQELHCLESQDIYKILLALPPWRTLAKILPQQTAHNNIAAQSHSSHTGVEHGAALPTTFSCRLNSISASMGLTRPSSQSLDEKIEALSASSKGWVWIPFQSIFSFSQTMPHMQIL